jgi:hypothetical protein
MEDEAAMKPMDDKAVLWTVRLFCFSGGSMALGILATLFGAPEIVCQVFGILIHVSFVGACFVALVLRLKGRL